MAQRPVVSIEEWLVGGGELGALIRDKDWSTTPLGPAEAWPQSLRSAVSILLPSRAQICLFWGPELIAIYNDAYRPTLGLKHPWALGRPAREVWSEFWDDVLRPLLEGVLDTGDALWASDHPFFLERRGYPEETYYDISYDPVRDESGRVGGVFCIVSETSGRVFGERRLRVLRDLGRIASEVRSVDHVFQRAAAALESCPNDVAFAGLYDARGRRVAGCRLNECDGWPFDEAESNGELVLQGDALRPFGKLSGGTWPEPARAVIILPLTVPNRGLEGFLVLGTSPRLELDESYRNFLRLVAGSLVSALGTARALEEEKARAEALAELDRAKTAFFSNVSHEFRTPLTLMLGPLEEMLTENAGVIRTPDRDRMEVVQRNAIRLQKLVNTLLDFSRLEAGRANATYAPIDIATYTAELVSNFESACEKANIALRVECPPLPPLAWVDAALWEKIVLNLVSNALKFTFDGEIAVSVRENGDRIELQVRDTGIGISAEEVPRLFERFHRVQGARGRTHEGSGIGLALVHELVRLHGGDITVDSEPGKGTSFRVRIPKGFAHLPQEKVVDLVELTDSSARAFAEESASWLAPSDTEPLSISPANADARILVVDDNADMRGYIARLLRAHWHVTAVANGAAALKALETGEYDVVVSDIMMPEMDGFELLRAIRTRQAGDVRTRVVLVSARAGEEARLEGIDAGADDYIVKPFSAAQLVAQVRAQISIRHARRDSERERSRLLAAERMARQEAELQRQHLVSLFSQAPNPIVILRGPQHIVDLANHATCRIWARREEEVLGRPLLEVLPELSGQKFRDFLDDVLATGIPHDGKEVPATFQRADGSIDTVYFNFVYTPLRNPHGGIDGILVTAFDVTDEVVARREMGRLRSEAEAASRAKDEFLAVLSHELRNPLAPIVTTLRLLRMRGDDSREIDLLERQAAHLTRLVDDLLDVSRITRRRIELRRYPLELSSVLDRALEVASPLLEERQQLVDTSAVIRTGLTVLADPDRLAQVISNLLTNAAKYSERGSKITISAEPTAGGTVQLSVRDQGIGIPPEQIDRVFDLFFQQPQSMERSRGGLGLGLAIVRHLVDLHGGTVKVRSDGLGAGSEFTVELPLAKAAEPVDPAPLPARDLRTPRRVLVVDDNQDAADSLAALLRHLGHEVDIAHDGPSGLAAAQTQAPEFAFIDIGLPGIDGYELAARFREFTPTQNRTSLIALTGYGLPTDRERSAMAGFVEHLVKPVDLHALEAILAERGQPDSAAPEYQELREG